MTMLTINDVNDLVEYAEHHLALSRAATDARDQATAHKEADRAAYALRMAKRALAS